jgi:PAS domain S-box-containing protein
MFIPEERERVQQNIRKTLTGEEFEDHDYTGLRKDSSTFPVLVYSAPIIKKDKPVGVRGIVLDITERKRTQQKVEEQLQFLQTLLDTIPSPVFYKNAEGRYTGCNKAFEDFVGIPAEEIVGKTVYDMGPKEIADKYYEKDRELFEKPGKQHYEWQVKADDGELKDVIFNKATIRDTNGDVEGLIGVISDITERKMFEEALRKSEERHRLFLQASPVPIVVYDIEGRSTYVNPAFERTFGWSSEELLGKRIDFVPEENRPETKAAIDRMLRGERIESFETRRLTKAGQILDIQLSSSLFRDSEDKPAGNIVILSDVTEQKQAEEALRDSVENFRALAENANDGILIAVGEGAHVYANKRATEITGYSVAELLKIGLHEFTAPDEVEKVADRFKRRLNGENVRGQYETALVKKSGEIFPAELSSARSVWEGQPASIVIFRDITGRKQAEEALRKREAELEIRANELEELNSALRVLLKRREEDQKELEEKVLSNVKELVLPYVGRLKKSALGAAQNTYVNILESNLEDIVSPFVRKLSSTYLGLTPTEIHVANLVKEARDSKTIAELLNMSPRTVESHRQNIRRKLGLKNKKANLRSHLLSI